MLYLITDLLHKVTFYVVAWLNILIKGTATHVTPNHWKQINSGHFVTSIHCQCERYFKNLFLDHEKDWNLPATGTVGNGMWACQAMRVKRQKLRIAQLNANEQRILQATTNRSEESVSHSLECTQDRTDFRSDLTVLNDLTVMTKMMRGK